MKTTSLYVHIPFCEHICRYCDFCKVYYRKDLSDQYLDVLNKELDSLKIKEPLKTIYIGGGTPSAFNENQLKRLMEMLKRYTGHVEEYAIEVNPESMNEKKLKILKEGGINRLSIGVQSFQDRLLDRIDRHHDTKMVLSLIDQAKKMGFHNISIDLMYGLPKQTLDDIKKDLDMVETLDLQHISYYSLILEDSTILKYEKYEKIDDEIEYEMNQYIDQRLEDLGFKKYEVSNYSKEGFESKHNLVYWHYENYYGIGVGASSKIDNRIIEHSRSLTKYLKGTDVSHIIENNKEDMMFEYIMMSLRLREGLDLNVFKDRYDIDVISYFKNAVDKNIKKEYLYIEDDHLKVSVKGEYLLNDILVDFMEDMD